MSQDNSYIYDDKEAIEKTVSFLQSIESRPEARKLVELLKRHSFDFPMCSNAYARKHKCAYASVCDCCQLTNYFGNYCCELTPIKALSKWIKGRRRRPLVYTMKYVAMFIGCVERLKGDI